MWNIRYVHSYRKIINDPVCSEAEYKHLYCFILLIQQRSNSSKQLFLLQTDFVLALFPAIKPTMKNSFELLMPCQNFAHMEHSLYLCKCNEDFKIYFVTKITHRRCYSKLINVFRPIKFKSSICVISYLFCLLALTIHPKCKCT